jgi:hypothetical protein
MPPLLYDLNIQGVLKQTSREGLNMNCPKCNDSIKLFKIGLIAFLCLFAQNSAACTMVGPAAGIYSGGTLLIATIIQTGTQTLYYVAALLFIVVLLKSLVFSRLMGHSTGRFFLVMILANIATTILGIAVEIIHMAAGWLILLPVALLMVPIFTLPIRTLQNHPQTPAWIQAHGKLTILLLTLLFTGTSLLGTALQNSGTLSDQKFLFWTLKIIFGISALSITLLLTATYEFSVIRKVSKCNEASLLPNVVRANLIIYALLFTGIVLVTSLITLTSA